MTIEKRNIAGCGSRIMLHHSSLCSRSPCAIQRCEDSSTCHRRNCKCFVYARGTRNLGDDAGLWLLCHLPLPSATVLSMT